MEGENLETRAADIGNTPLEGSFFFRPGVQGLTSTVGFVDDYVPFIENGQV